MITCRDCIELLIDLVSGELSAEYRQHCEQHLQACPPCLVYLETYKITIRLTRQLPDEPPPPQLMERLREMLEQCQEGAGGAAQTE